jgi:hypothetical protein
MDPLIAASDWGPFLQTVIGALIGAMGAIAGGAFGSWFTWQNERRSVAAAFAGEIHAILGVVGWRRARDAILKGKGFPIEEHPFPVWEANVSKVGFLPADLAAKVAGFYSLAAGIVQDLKILSSHAQIGNPQEFRESLSKSVADAENEAKGLVSELRNEAKKAWRI